MEFESYDLIAMVDAQPGPGNHSLPSGILPDIVFDHHPFKKLTREVSFSDVRVIMDLAVPFCRNISSWPKLPRNVPLATALLYGIRSDTQDLGREAVQADIEAFEWVYPPANKRMLSSIQRGSVPMGYFQLLSVALTNARIYDKAIVTCLGPVDNPDMIGEVADLFLREEQTCWTLCMGCYEGKILMSVRTSDENGQAGEVIKKVVSRRGTGGGHQTYAGGQFPSTRIPRPR